MTLRRMLPFILVNILVSAAVVLTILYWWDNSQTAETSSAVQAPSIATPGRVAPTEAPRLPTEEPASEDEGPLFYTVRTGDTLGTISIEFDISIEELMAANDLTDPNFVGADQQLIIPTGDEVESIAPEPTPEEVAPGVPTPIATLDLSSGEARVEITEVVSVGILTEEAVSINNSGDKPVALLGWRLMNAAGQAYTFGQVTLFGEGAGILVHTGEGTDGPSDLYWGIDQALWSSGETVSLVDAEGTVRSAYLIEG